ncbi:MAG: MFS transporter [Pseudomonadaceae bacterium]|jgi:MFS family permease|nr:MFS transporter [Pseudomonadaceae bacterium]QCT96629.1 MFS transporter [Stutzerimonas degradans]
MNAANTDGRTTLVVWIILTCGVVAALHLGKAAIATPMLQADLHLSLDEAGWLTGLFAGLGLLCGAPAGAVAAAFGGRNTLLLGLGVMVLAGAGGAAMPSYPGLLVTRFLEGLGFMLVIVAGPAILERVTTGAERDVAFGLWSCFMPCGMALAMLAGPLFQTWQSFWWTSAALAVASIGVVTCRVPPSASPKTFTLKTMQADIRQLLCSRGAMLLALGFALYSLVFFALFSFLPVLLMERMDVSYRSAGVLSALASAMNASGNLAAGYLIARGAGRVQLVVIASTIMGLSGMGIFLGGLPAFATFLLCLFFSAIGGLIPATLLASAPLVARQAALVPITVGLMMQGSNLGQMLGSVAVGSVTTAFGWEMASAVVAMATVATGAVAFLLRPVLRDSVQYL